jgi:hypothetical protein
MYGYIQFLISSFYSRVIAIRSFLWLRLRQHPCEALLGEYVSLLSTYSFKFTFDPDFLADSPFVDDLEHIIRCFDKTTKLRFRKAEEPQYIKFGSTRDNDEAYSIRFGQLKLMG